MKLSIKIITFLLLYGSIDSLFSYMPNQVQAFLTAVKKSDGKINCSGCDFRGVQDFVGLDLHNIFMPNVSMQPCLQTDVNKNSSMICIAKQATNLFGVNLSYATLFSSCLDGVILAHADLTGADLSDASLQYATLQDAIIKDVITTNATFCQAIMPDGKKCIDSWTGQGVTIDCNCGKTQAEQPIETSSKNGK